MMFTARMFHSAVSWISHETQMVVVSVDYRRSPEHPFPRPLLDVYYTVLWAQLNDSKLGESLPVCILWAFVCINEQSLSILYVLTA